MNSRHLPARTIKQAQASHPVYTHLSGHWLILVRLAWIALVLFMLGVSVTSLPASFATLHQPCLASAITCSGLGLLTAPDLQALPTVGFSQDAYAWFWIVSSSGPALVLFVVGGNPLLAQIGRLDCSSGGVDVHQYRRDNGDG